MTTQSLAQAKPKHNHNRHNRHNRIDIVEVDFPRQRIIFSRPGINPRIFHRPTATSWRRVIKLLDRMAYAGHRMAYAGQCIVRPCATGFFLARLGVVQ